VWRYGPSNLSAVVREADLSVSSNSLSTTFPASTITLLVVSSATVVVIPDGGTPDGGPDAGPTAGGLSSGIQGGCASAPGPVGGLALHGLLLALSRLRGRVSPRPRSQRD
jgi:hypothetical protein